MKNWIGIFKVLMHSIILSALMAACETENANLDVSGLDDLQLIEAIENSTGKFVIGPDKLPDSALYTLENDYPGNYADWPTRLPSLATKCSSGQG